MSTNSLLKIIIAMTSKAEGHAKLVYPEPRDPQSNGGNKRGPCGPVAKSATPKLTLTAGEEFNFQWTETINHPGRFLFAISKDGDQTFQQFASVIDTQNTPGVHFYQEKLKVPNVTCDNCTLQMIQSMEENPSAPTFYFSCADVKIVAANTTAQSGVTSQSSLSGETTSKPLAEGTKFGGGCGVVKLVAEEISKAGSSSISHMDRGAGSGYEKGPWNGALGTEVVLVFLIPFLTWLILRKSQVPLKNH